MKRAGIVGVLLLLLVTVGVGAWWLLGDTSSNEEDVLDAELDDWFAPSGSVADAPVRANVGGREQRAAPDEREARDDRREARRERWRDRKGGRRGGRFSPEQRERWRERFRQRISVRAPNGTELPAGVASNAQDDVFELFGQARPLVRECLHEAGVDGSIWRQARGESRQLSFDVTAEGTVNAESFQIEPPLPEPLGSCFAAGFAEGVVQPPGPEGASVSVEMPSRRRRRGRDGSTGDGGV